jgi:hypothetical protein
MRTIPIVGALLGVLLGKSAGATETITVPSQHFARCATAVLT